MTYVCTGDGESHASGHKQHSIQFFSRLFLKIRSHILHHLILHQSTSGKCRIILFWGFRKSREVPTDSKGSSCTLSTTRFFWKKTFSQNSATYVEIRRLHSWKLFTPCLWDLVHLEAALWPPRQPASTSVCRDALSSSGGDNSIWLLIIPQRRTACKPPRKITLCSSFGFV